MRSMNFLYSLVTSRGPNSPFYKRLRTWICYKSYGSCNGIRVNFSLFVSLSKFFSIFFNVSQKYSCNKIWCVIFFHLEWLPYSPKCTSLCSFSYSPFPTHLRFSLVINFRITLHWLWHTKYLWFWIFLDPWCFLLTP